VTLTNKCSTRSIITHLTVVRRYPGKEALMPTTAHDVAAMVISEQHAAGRSIDKLQLQKLLYLVQGANLEFWGEPAFRESLLAYRNGPVVRDVEATYRDASVRSAPLQRAVGGHPERLDRQVVDTIRTVLRYFGAWTGPNLERYVKSPDSPWQLARTGVPADASSDVEIPLPAVAAWFRSHGVNPSPRGHQPWEANAEQRQAADGRLREAKAFGAFVPSVTPDLRGIAERALIRLHSDD
jgi:uncharacterized phage-associated protein